MRPSQYKFGVLKIAQIREKWQGVFEEFLINFKTRPHIERICVNTLTEGRLKMKCQPLIYQEGRLVTFSKKYMKL